MVRMGDQMTNLFELRLADIQGQHPNRRKEGLNQLNVLIDRVHALNEVGVPCKLPAGTGNLIMSELELKPGAVLGDIMKKLTQLLVDGVLTLDADFAKEARIMVESSELPG